jgi:hypothetical protein
MLVGIWAARCEMILVIPPSFYCFMANNNSYIDTYLQMMPNSYQSLVETAKNETIKKLFAGARVQQK